MLDEEIVGFDVFCSFGARNVAIFLKRKSAHVVLVNNVGLNIITLGLEELTRPKNVARFVVQSNNLAFGRTLGRYALFCRRTRCSTTTKGKN